MPRPTGHKLSRPALDDILRLSGLSLTQLAELADVPRATVSSLYGGHHRASVPTCHKLARAADCDPRTLFPTLSTDTAAA